MALTFDHIINLTTYTGNPSPVYVSNMMFANEPNNDIHHLYISDQRTADKASSVVNANYTSLVWASPERSMTSDKVKRIGLKNFPRVGAISFYSLLHEERSFIFAPLYIKNERFTRPTFSATQTATTVTFTMAAPADITYTCWRVVMRLGDTAFEYISYEDTITVDNPYLSGSYDCYCVGYVGEGIAVSDDSLHLTLTITGSGVDPLDRFEYYTKNEIDAIIAAIKQNTTYTVTLTAAGWVGAAAPYTQTVQVQGIVTTGYVYVVSPACTGWSAYCSSGIYMDEPTVANTLTFTATGAKPATDLTVNILKVGVT